VKGSDSPFFCFTDFISFTAMIVGLKFILKTAGLTIGGLVLIFVMLSLFAPRYNFPDPKPFSGKQWYNPYQDLDTSRWLKANFQVQSRVWGGLTNGRRNRSDQVVSLYQRLGYDVICFSDYQFINRYNEKSSLYIPAYEHGFGIRKWHQVCIGAHGRTWLDYPFWQTLSQKQNIINTLNTQNDIVAIAHPKLCNAFSTNDFKYLSGYQLIEVFNQFRCSEAHWDKALSSGHPAFMLSDDDAHDISNPHEVARFCTYIKPVMNNRKSVIDALKAGRAYGAEIYMAELDGYPEKIAYARQMPSLRSARIVGDTFSVKVSQDPRSIRFIGQNGVVKSTVTGSKQASYLLRKDDTYIRTEIVFPNHWGGDGTRFLLNPVFRYTGKNPALMPEVTVDATGTRISRGFALATLVFIVMNSWFIGKKINSRKKQRKMLNEQYG
jgi:hypothetical protein